MPKVTLTEEQVGLTIQAVASVLEALEHDLRHYDNSNGMDDLFLLLELSSRFAEVWMTLQEALGVPQEALRQLFRED